MGQIKSEEFFAHAYQIISYNKSYGKQIGEVLRTLRWGIPRKFNVYCEHLYKAERQKKMD